VHNGARFVQRALDSVLGQTMQDFEIIAVDDGSTDETSEVIASVQDRRVRLVSQPNRGLASARNRGVDEANGKLIAFLDADDEWLPDKLSKQLSSFRPGVVVYSDVMFWDDRRDQAIGTYVVFDRFPRRADKFSGDLLTTLLAQSVVHPSSIMIAREDFNVVGAFDVSFPLAEDWDLCLRCAETMTFVRIEEPLVKVYRRPDSLSSDSARMIVAGTKVLEAARGRLIAAGRFDDRLKAAAALGDFGVRDMSRARRSLFAAAARRPWMIGRWRWAVSALLWGLLRGRE
jgi:glycosyltransferase involved in cell wall biosynthesis